MALPASSRISALKSKWPNWLGETLSNALRSITSSTISLKNILIVEKKARYVGIVSFDVGFYFGLKTPALLYQGADFGP